MMRAQPVYIICWLALGFIHLLSYSCKVKPDPCLGAIQAKASFKMYQSIAGNKKIEVDTILRGTSISFESFTPPPMTSYSAYYWRIGTDERTFGGKSASLTFDVLGKLNARLVVKNKAYPECYPNDDGLDTLAHSFVIVDQNKPVFLGTFEGYSDDAPTIKKEIRIVWHPRTYLPYPDVIRIYGFSSPCGNALMQEPYIYSLNVDSWQYREFEMRGSGATGTNGYPNCGLFYGFGKVENGNKLTINYTNASNEDNTTLNKTFIGYRKN